MPPGSTRLGHRKSRNGCLRCKARHVKCDEKRPCTNCVRFDIPCSLLEGPHQASTLPVNPGDTVNANQTSEPPPSRGLKRKSPEPGVARERPTVPLKEVSAEAAIRSPSGFSDAVPSAEPSPQTVSASSPLIYDSHGADHELSPLWMQSLRLLHYYSTEVYKMLCRDPSTAPLWKTVVPEVAFSNKFLMHGLLAVSAFHYALNHPEHHTEYMLVSHHFQTLALQYFATHLGDISSENFEPYFFLATFIFMLAMWSIAHPNKEELTPRAVAHSFHLLQGIKLIVAFKPVETWPRDGPLSPLIHSWEPVNPKKPGPFQSRMDKLSTIARGLTPSLDVINNQSSCLLAIESLRNMHSASCTCSTTGCSRQIWIWPITLTPYFTNLIGEHHPVALIIVAHYAALARPFEHPSWVNKGWSANVFKSIECAMESEWDEWIEWIDWPKKSLEECINVDDMDAEMEAEPATTARDLED